MQKVRAKDGTIEFVSEETKARFISQGKSCLIWNTQAALARSQTCWIIGFPAISASGFPGSRLAAIRAGMIMIVLLLMLMMRQFIT